MLRFALRLIIITTMLSVYLIRARVPVDRRTLQGTAIRTSRWARRFCRVLGIHFNRLDLKRAERGRMIVLNHLSWIDPLIMAAIHPAVFVTSAETGEHPLLGRICASAGCVFMERRSRNALGSERDHLAGIMQGMPVVVFPEATSSSGDRLLPFKPATFASAISANVPVDLLVLRYTAVDGRTLGRRERDWIHWYGNMAFIPHLLRLLTLVRVDASVHDLGLIRPGLHDDRKALASRAHRVIADHLRGSNPRRHCETQGWVPTHPQSRGFQTMGIPLLA